MHIHAHSGAPSLLISKGQLIADKHRHGMYLLASKEDVHPNNAAMQERKKVKAEVKYQPTAHQREQKPKQEDKAKKPSKRINHLRSH